MGIQLISMSALEQKQLSEAEKGEILTTEVKLQAGEEVKTYRVFLEMGVLAPLNAGLLNTDEAFARDFRMDQNVIQKVCQLVGHFRRGQEFQLPILIQDEHPTTQAQVV